MTTTKQNYEVYATVNLPISIKVDAENEDQAQMIANLMLNNLTIQEAKLQLIKVDGEVLEPTVHDVEVDVGEVF